MKTEPRFNFARLVDDCRFARTVERIGFARAVVRTFSFPRSNADTIEPELNFSRANADTIERRFNVAHANADTIERRFNFARANADTVERGFNFAPANAGRIERGLNFARANADTVEREFNFAPANVDTVERGFNFARAHDDAVERWCKFARTIAATIMLALLVAAAFSGCAAGNRALKPDAQLVVAAAVPDARIYVDDVFAGRAAELRGRALLVRSGVLRVEVRADGYFTAYRDVTVAPGARAAVDVALRAAPANEPAE